MATNTILHQGEQFKIRPSDLNTGGHLWDAFGNYETEVSARYILTLCQQRGNWEPFDFPDIEEVYQVAGYRWFNFNRLLRPDENDNQWIAPMPDNRFYITEEFVIRLFATARLAQSNNSNPDEER